MKYLLLLNTPDGGAPEAGTPEAQRLYERYSAAARAMGDGVVVECVPLHRPAAATTVRVRDGRSVLTDGPAAELKEQVGGYAVLDCPTIEQAIAFATLLPAAEDGSVEIRPVFGVAN
ncbi:MAG TPA: YciI family protein [Pseudonocardiaceae bacterium]|jgi:hypothetical protein|nr:YciI family protein [Pseudonocardiaceae bacterium]